MSSRVTLRSRGTVLYEGLIDLHGRIHASTAYSIDK